MFRISQYMRELAAAEAAGAYPAVRSRPRQGPQPAADLETTEVRQADIQHHQVDIASLQLLQRLPAQQAMAGGVAFAAQRIEHGFGDGRFVFDHQDMGNRGCHGAQHSRCGPCPVHCRP